MYTTIGLSFFFFQAEAGIRYYRVTGVQTFALPISPAPAPDAGPGAADAACAAPPAIAALRTHAVARHRLGEGGAVSIQAEPQRSEERRVGKECRSRWSPYH